MQRRHFELIAEIIARELEGEHREKAAYAFAYVLPITNRNFDSQRFLQGVQGLCIHGGPQPMNQEETLEGMMDNMGLPEVLLILQSICYAKADHIEANWQDYGLAREWKMTGNTLGKWAKTLTTLH